MISVLKGYFNPSRSPYSSRTCKVVLIEHDIAVDINYLNKLGFNVARIVFDCINTSDLYKASRRNGRQCALSTLLLKYDIAVKYLHNTNNNASYTLRIIIVIALDNSQNRRNTEE